MPNEESELERVRLLLDNARELLRHAIHMLEESGSYPKALPLLKKQADDLAGYDHGLRLIGPAEAAVLDAWALESVEDLECIIEGEADEQPGVAAAKAELARRQQQAEKGRE